MPVLKIKNLYAKDLENEKKYKTYDVFELEYQDNGDDEKFAKIINAYTEKNMDALEAYDALAKDMIIFPLQAQTHKFFGKNATAAVGNILAFLLKYGNDDMFAANKKLKIEETDGE